MKSYTITVNGTAYEVTVEETGSVSAPAAAPKAAAPAAGAGAVKVTASVPGKLSSSSKRWTGSKSRRQRNYS